MTNLLSVSARETLNWLLLAAPQPFVFLLGLNKDLETNGVFQ